MNIASLEDDPDQAAQILHTLTAGGHTVRNFSQSRDLMAALRTESFDLILLDWHLPDIDGDSVLHWIRTNLGMNIPVMFLTSRSQEADIVQGLQAGADDYIIKPWRAGELLARVTALLRRTHGMATEPGAFQVEGYHIDPTARQISLNGEPITLAPKEFELAALFFRNLGRLFSRDVLAESVWNRDIPATSRTLDTHLSNIRQKLRLRPENGVKLSSSYALGYRLEVVSDTAAGPSGKP